MAYLTFRKNRQAEHEAFELVPSRCIAHIERRDRGGCLISDRAGLNGRLGSVRRRF